MGAASCKWPLAERSKCLQWTLLPDAGKSCLFLPPSCQHQCFQSLCSQGKEKSQALVSLPPLSTVFLSYSSLPLLAVLETAFSGLSALISDQFQSFTLL